MTRQPFAFVTKQGKVVRHSMMDAYATKDAQEESKQIQDPFSSSDFSERGLVQPPYNPVSLIKLLELNTYHVRSCRVKSRDVAGHGWSVVPAGGAVDSESDEAQARKTVVEEWLDSIDNLAAVLAEGQFDFEAIGWGAAEITTGLHNMPTNMFHIPAHTLRVHRSRTKWMQRRANKRVWFQDISSNKMVNRLTGQTMMVGEPGVQSGSMVMTWHNHHPVSDYYGVTDIIPALGAITGDVSRRDYNISFFDNYGVPAYAVFITGDFDPGEPELLDGDDPDNPTGPTPLEKAIEEQFAELAQNPHSIMVLSIPTSITDDFGGEGGKVEVEIKPLSVDVKEASFRMYRQDNRDEVLSAHGVDPYRVGLAETGSLGGTTAEQASEIYKESVITPRQEAIEALINKWIISGMLGIREWQFKLNELDTTNVMEDLQLLSGLFVVGAVTPRQIAEAFASRFGIDTSEMDHPALNAHYIGGQPVDIAMADVTMNGEQVVAALNSLNESLFSMSVKNNGHVSREEFARVKKSLDDLKAMSN